MRLFLRSNRTSLLALLVVIALVLLAIVVTALTPSPRPVLIGKSVTIYHAPKTGGGISVPGYFSRAWRHHAWCKQPTTRAKRGIHGVFRQNFLRCTMALGPVKISRLPLPPPSVRPAPTPIAQPRPSSTPAPRATVPVVSSQPQPTATAQPVQPTQSLAGLDPVQYELALMNRTRSSSLPAYTLNQTESDGTGLCPGSYGHALHMSQVGAISHDQFPGDICVPFTAAGENVGEAGGYSVTGALDVIHAQMMAEPHDPATCAQLAAEHSGNHACSIISPSYHSVGIGIVTTNGTTWLAVDFLG